MTMADRRSRRVPWTLFGATPLSLPNLSVRMADRKHQLSFAAQLPDSGNSRPLPSPFAWDPHSNEATSFTAFPFPAAVAAFPEVVGEGRGGPLFLGLDLSTQVSRVRERKEEGS